MLKIAVCYSTVVLMIAAVANSARCDEKPSDPDAQPADTQPEAAATAAPKTSSDILPGFDEEGPRWDQVARIRITEGRKSTNDPDSKDGKKITRTNHVEIFRFADSGTRPFVEIPDPFSTDEPWTEDPAVAKERVKKRGDAWLKLVLENNPAVHLEILHMDLDIHLGLLSGGRSDQKVHFHELLNEPSEEVVLAARLQGQKNMSDRLQVYRSKKDQAKTVYYGINFALGAAALAVVLLVVLPAFRKRKAGT